MDHLRPLEEPVITGTEIVRSYLDLACEVKSIERFEARIMKDARPLFDFGGELDEPPRVSEHVEANTGCPADSPATPTPCAETASAAAIPIDTMPGCVHRQQRRRFP